MLPTEIDDLWPLENNEACAGIWRPIQWYMCLFWTPHWHGQLWFWSRSGSICWTLLLNCKFDPARIAIEQDGSYMKFKKLRRLEEGAIGSSCADAKQTNLEDKNYHESRTMTRQSMNNMKPYHGATERILCKRKLLQYNIYIWYYTLRIVMYQCIIIHRVYIILSISFDCFIVFVILLAAKSPCFNCLSAPRTRRAWRS